MSSLDKALIIPVPDVEVCNYAEIALPFLKMALESSDQRTTAAALLEDTKNRLRQLWIIKDTETDQYIAAVITMIYTSTSGEKIGEISFAGGSAHDKWDHFVEWIGHWMKTKEKCNFIDIVGRPGWQRLYQGRGFKLNLVQMRKAL